MGTILASKTLQTTTERPIMWQGTSIHTCIAYILYGYFHAYHYHVLGKGVLK